MTLRYFVTLTVCLMACGCTPYGYPMYAGPERAKTETALLEFTGSIKVRRIDGIELPNGNSGVSLLPGAHEVESSMSVVISESHFYPGQTSTIYRNCRSTYVSFEAEAGKHYLLQRGEHPSGCDVEIVDRDTEERISTGSWISSYKALKDKAALKAASENRSRSNGAAGQDVLAQTRRYLSEKTRPHDYAMAALDGCAHASGGLTMGDQVFSNVDGLFRLTKLSMCRLTVGTKASTFIMALASAGDHAVRPLDVKVEFQFLDNGGSPPPLLPGFIFYADIDYCGGSELQVWEVPKDYQAFYEQARSTLATPYSLSVKVKTSPQHKWRKCTSRSRRPEWVKVGYTLRRVVEVAEDCTSTRLHAYEPVICEAAKKYYAIHASADSAGAN